MNKVAKLVGDELSLSGFLGYENSWYRRNHNVEQWVTVIEVPRRVKEKSLSGTPDVRLFDVQLYLFSEELSVISQDDESSSSIGRAQLDYYLKTCRTSISKSAFDIKEVYVCEKSAEAECASEVATDLKLLLENLESVSNLDEFGCLLLRSSGYYMRRLPWTMWGLCVALGAFAPTDYPLDQFLANFRAMDHPVRLAYNSLVADAQSRCRNEVYPPQ